MCLERLRTRHEGMDSLDYEGTLVEMGSLLAQGRLDWRNKAAFFARVREKKSEQYLELGFSLNRRCRSELLRSSCSYVFVFALLLVLCPPPPDLSVFSLRALPLLSFCLSFFFFFSFICHIIICFHPLLYLYLNRLCLIYRLTYNSPFLFLFLPLFFVSVIFPVSAITRPPPPPQERFGHGGSHTLLGWRVHTLRPVRLGEHPRLQPVLRHRGGGGNAVGYDE